MPVTLVPGENRLLLKIFEGVGGWNFSVRFQDEQNGLIAGLGGVILRSEDGGQTWSYRKVDRKQALAAKALAETPAQARARAAKGAGKPEHYEPTPPIGATGVEEARVASPYVKD